MSTDFYRSQHSGMPNDALLVDTDRIATLEIRRTELLHELHEVETELWMRKARQARLANQALPVASLPNEILSTIFLLCRGTKVVFTRELARPFEFMLSHVSTHWRSVALDTASFWSAINLFVTRRTRRYELQRLSVQLKRSAQCLLNITLRFDFFKGISDLLYHLTPHAQRWFRLSIYTNCGSPDDIYAPLEPLSVPHLIHLSLRIGDSENNFDDFETEYPEKCATILTQGAPSLTFVRVAGKIVGNLAPPLSTIRTLHVDAWLNKTLNLAQFSSLLAALPCLVHLSLTGLSIHLPRDPLQTTEPISLPLLQSLRIRGNDTPWFRLLPLLSLPNLKSLSLHDIETFRTVVVPSLRNLTLSSCELRQKGLKRLFKSFPQLTTLDSDNSTWSMYHLLTPDVGPSTNIPWPELQTILLREGCDADGFVKVCLRRLECGSPLRRVCLDMYSRRSFEVRDLLDRLRELQPVEYVDKDEPWPADLGYEDPDDTWY